MEREIFEKCRYCGSDIVFREGQDFVRCASCGETLAIAEFLKEQTQTAKAEQENEKGAIPSGGKHADGPPL